MNRRMMRLRLSTYSDGPSPLDTKIMPNKESRKLINLALQVSQRSRWVMELPDKYNPPPLNTTQILIFLKILLYLLERKKEKVPRWMRRFLHWRKIRDDDRQIESGSTRSSLSFVIDMTQPIHLFLSFCFSAFHLPSSSATFMRSLSLANLNRSSFYDLNNVSSQKVNQVGGKFMARSCLISQSSKTFKYKIFLDLNELYLILTM